MARFSSDDGAKAMFYVFPVSYVTSCFHTMWHMAAWVKWIDNSRTQKHGMQFTAKIVHVQFDQ